MDIRYHNNKIFLKKIIKMKFVQREVKEILKMNWIIMKVYFKNYKINPIILDTMLNQELNYKRKFEWVLLMSLKIIIF